MDFTTISKKLENSSIKSPVEFHHALHHAFLNIAMSLDNGTVFDSSEVSLNFYIWDLLLISNLSVFFFTFQEIEMTYEMYRFCINLIDDEQSLSLPV